MSKEFDRTMRRIGREMASDKLYPPAKTCTKCKKRKPLTDFFRREIGSSDGRMSSCKDCKTKSIYEWRRRNKKRWNDYTLGRWKAGFRVPSYNKQKRAIYKRKTRYLITNDEFEFMLNLQHGRCAICTSEFSSFNEPAVDHDHDADYVRGLLCRACNHGLGNFRDSATFLKVAALYLEQSFPIFKYRQAKRLQGVR